MDKISDIVQWDPDSHVPKYRQIISAIEMALIEEKLQVGDRVPSLNQWCKEFSLSQDTVLTAYNDLKSRGIIASTVGKGYFITKVDLATSRKIFLLFDKLTAYKEVLYESFKKAIGQQGIIDIYFHHGNGKVLETLLTEAAGNYTDYAIMPAPIAGMNSMLAILPSRQVIILDQDYEKLASGYRSVYQNFERDIYNALSAGLDHLRKYRQIVFVSHDDRGHFKALQTGCQRFCQANGFEFSKTSIVDEKLMHEAQAWIVTHDQELVDLVKLVSTHPLQLGKTFGIISYNDVPMKEVIAGGITTISTDFEQMGKNLADIILKRQNVHIENPSNLILRNSL